MEARILLALFAACLMAVPIASAELPADEEPILTIEPLACDLPHPKGCVPACRPTTDLSEAVTRVIECIP